MYHSGWIDFDNDGHLDLFVVGTSDSEDERAVLLFHNDGSLGVHNPFFASDTLIASRDALIEAAGRTGWDEMRRQPRQQQLPTERSGANRWTSWSSRSR